MTAYDALRAALADRYRLERELGAGGMATVFLAHDLRHDRRVAIKVLKPELGALLGVERFLKEIRVTANLQHPAILTLHDSGEAAGLLFYVMPYVEGETLRARLVRESQLPVAAAVRIASEIAGALDYAHRHGVLHRDIKPENVLLVEGHALLADFGIALAIREAGGNRLTGTGVSLGTPQYMSPEQAMGDRVLDARTDVYALAAVTYEMLAGTPPHTGPHAQAIIAKLVAEEPRTLTRERPSTPPHVAAAVHRGLAKLAPDRFQSAAEFAEALSRPGTGAIASSDAGGALAGRGSWKSWSRDRRTLAALGVAVVATGLTSASLWRGLKTSTTSDAALRFDIGPPESLTDVRADGSRFSLAIAPDDRHVAFTAAHGDTSVVFVRALDRFTTYEVRGGEARSPFFSPDGRQLGFVRGGDLWKLNLETGDMARIGPLGEAGWNLAGAAWHPNGDIFAVGSRGVWRVASDGTPPRLVAPNDSSTGWAFAWFPTVLPNGRMLVPIGREKESRVAVLSPEGERLRELPKQFTGAPWYANGRLILATTALSIVRFDPNRLEPLDAPIELSKRSLDPDTTARFPFLQVSERGSAAWYDTEVETRELVWVTRSGSATPLSLPPAAYRGPQLAPDGHRLAVNPGREQVFVYDLRSGVRTQLGRARWSSTEPVWAPDGRMVAFALFPGPRIGGWRSQSRRRMEVRHLRRLLAEVAGERSSRRTSHLMVAGWHSTVRSGATRRMSPSSTDRPARCAASRFGASSEERASHETASSSRINRTRRDSMRSMSSPGQRSTPNGWCRRAAAMSQRGRATAPSCSTGAAIG